MDHLSQRYADTLRRIPLPPPPPPPRPLPVHPSVDDELLSTLHAPSSNSEFADSQEHGYENDPSNRRSFRSTNAAEDAARELEESVLGPGKGKGKAKDPKRPASRGASEASSSDLEVPVDPKKHASKKRKLSKPGGDITADLERSIADDQRSVASTQDTVRLMPATKGRGKGKGKQVLQREQSMDSISTTPKAARKRPGPRRKADTLPPHTQEHLGIGSIAASVAGDSTPAGSRPASPALTATDATVYEIDEIPPPLKKAKKVDDATMLKRVKVLEEAQRKVWKSIARREVAKVYRYGYPVSLHIVHSFHLSGLQVPCHGLPATSGSAKAGGNALFHPSSPTLHPNPQGNKGRASEEQASHA